MTNYEYVPVEKDGKDKSNKFKKRKNSSIINLIGSNCSLLSESEKLDKKRANILAKGIGMLTLGSNKKGYLSKKDIVKHGRSKSMARIGSFAKTSIFEDDDTDRKKKVVKRTAAYERRKFASNLEVDLKLAPVNKEIPIFDQKSKTLIPKKF